jgi:hypothetical protein
MIYHKTYIKAISQFSVVPGYGKQNFLISELPSHRYVSYIEGNDFDKSIFHRLKLKSCDGNINLHTHLSVSHTLEGVR